MQKGGGEGSGNLASYRKSEEVLIEIIKRKYFHNKRKKLKHIYAKSNAYVLLWETIYILSQVKGDSLKVLVFFSINIILIKFQNMNTYNFANLYRLIVK